MLKEGKDPKDLLIKDCEPHCLYWKDKLTRCELKLEYFGLILEKSLRLTRPNHACIL